MVENTLPKVNKDLIFILIIFVLIVISAASLFGGWKYIDQLQTERDLLRHDNKELIKEKEDLSKTLKERKKINEKIIKERDILRISILNKEEEIKTLKEKYEKELINIDNSDINDDVRNVSNIFSKHSRR